VAYFEDSEDLRRIMGGFFEQLREDSQFGPQVRAAAVQATFFFSDPALTVTIDAVNPPQQGGDFNVYYGDPPLEAPLKLSLSADNAHRLWQGRLNVMLALSQNQIGIEGSMGRALALLPAVQPAFARYRAYLGQIGRPDLLV
jgi:hypothetical protein